MDDLISKQAAIDALNHELRCGAVINQCGLEMAYEVIEGLPSAQPDTYWEEQCQSYEQTINKLRESLSTQPEIIRCKDCKYWVPGYITDNDDFIPPKCGEWQQMVGHSSDDYCSLAERREVTE